MESGRDRPAAAAAGEVGNAPQLPGLFADNRTGVFSEVYRVYDWDRKDEQGKTRELHIEKALQVIDFSARPRIFRRRK